MKAFHVALLLSPFLSAPLVLALGRRLGSRTGWAALAAPLLGLVSCAALYLDPQARGTTFSLSWVPSLGVALAFTADGLALFYGLLVAGMGLLVTLYATHYLDDRYGRHGSFYFTLQLFMGAMLVTVFTSNLLVLFVAWELTGITSFFLIGFQHDQPKAQRGARMALVTTVTTGLGLLAAIALLQQIFGTLDLTRILATPAPPESRGLLSVAFGLAALGILGKSALVPFHYWLPNAMAAPTPVSAYLHSATMVKLGVFLSARLFPVFGDLPTWGPVLVAFGFSTFLLGALLALLCYDLKAILAYTTVAQLGLLVGQYGWAAPEALHFGDLLHVLNHSLYKACLFMVVGIVDHCTGTRDLHQLGGLFRRMPLTGAVAMVGLAAMAGLPLTSGFVSKEILLETALHRPGMLGMFSLASLTLGSVLHALVALRVGRHVFLGKMPAQLEESFHAPSFGLQLPPLFLAAGVLLFGLWPAGFGAFAGSFGPATVPHLALWHGWTPAALVSLGIFATAGIAFWLTEHRGWARLFMPRAARMERIFDWAIDGIPAFGLRFNRALGFGRSSLYLVFVAGILFGSLMLFVIVRAGEIAALLGALGAPAPSMDRLLRWGVVAIVSVGTFLAMRWERPIPQLFAVSLAGFGVAYYYVLYRAPDLALTQLLVETATLLLVLLVVVRFKRDGADLEPLPPRSRRSRLARVAIATAGGLFFGMGVLLFPSLPLMERAGGYYLESSIPLARGANAVNTIVVDFRGFDTMLEITALLIAGLGCLGLLSRKRLSPVARFEFPHRDLLPVPRDFILQSVALGAFVPLNLFALHIFFRGHDAPGGGFVAGLITALSLILVSFVLGVYGFRRRLRVMPMVVAVLGVLLALGVASFPALQGLPPLSHRHFHLGPFPVGTPMLFDLGVYLAVVGVTLKLVLPLMKSVHGLPAFVQDEVANFTSALSEPIDYRPARPPAARTKEVA